MPANNHPESDSHLEPQEHEVEEMSFETAMKRAVDDLFTYEPISKRLQESDRQQEFEGLLSLRKQILVERLVETAYREVDELVTGLDVLLAKTPFDMIEADAPLPPPFQQRSDVGNRVE